MATLAVFPLFVLAAVLTVCSGQGFSTVSFQMNGVTGSAVFTWASKNVTTINLAVSKSLGDGNVSVEIRPVWVDYDVIDKCSNIQLGAPISKWTVSTVFTNNAATVTLNNVENLASLGGHSILLNGSSNKVCASIESSEAHPTAVAQFQGLIQGTVYFRQSFSPYTRVITDLYSNQNTYTSSWFITNDVATCQLITSTTQLKPYNPNKIDTSGCSNTSLTSCAVGQLTEKLGNVMIGGKKGENKFGYTDKTLSSIAVINGTLLLIKASNGSFACAAIKIFESSRGIVEFSNDGVTGSITFSQASPFDQTTTEVSLQGLRSLAKGYHVHLWPTPTRVVAGQDLCGDVVVSGHLNPFSKNTTFNYPAPDNSTDDMYEVGDLSSKYGTLASQDVVNNKYMDWNLPLYGSHSIIGRSVVIHHDDSSGSRWVCANIEPDNYRVVVAIAVLKYPVIGRVMFMQGEMGSSATSVFAQLDYNDGRPGTMKHKWGVRTNMVNSDMLAQNETLRCQSSGSIYDPQQMGQIVGEPQYGDYCSKNSPLGCKTGDLSGKLGLLNIRNAANLDTATRNFFVDSNLPLSGPYSIIGKSVFIMNEAGTSILACANIQPVHEPFLIATFSMGGLSGSVSFRQKAGFGAKKTVVTNELSVLASKNRLYVYELPPTAGSNMCSDLGSVFNPFNITQNASVSATDDKYKVGDLAHYGSMSTWDSFNLPLTGLASINQRSLVVVDQDNQNKIVACAKIITAGSSPIVEAVSNFTGAVTGSIHLFQTTNEDGTMTDTSIVVDLKNQDGHMSFNHNWHEHMEPVLGDANAVQGRCNSTKGHFDPYMTMTNVTNYATECRRENPLRCEVGDQSMKLGTYNLGEGRKVYTDVDLPLAGMYSGLGRAMVVHQEGKVLARLSCGDIIPVTGDPVAIEIRSTNLDRRAVAAKYATAIMADPSDVVVEFISQTNEVSKLQVHFVGFKREANRRQFMLILNSKDKSILDPYAPYTGTSSYSVVSATLLVAVLAVQLLNYL